MVLVEELAPAGAGAVGGEGMEVDKEGQGAEGDGEGAAAVPDAAAVAEVVFELLDPRIGAAYQLPDRNVPCAYAHDHALEVLARLPLQREGEEGCRWKAPPEGTGMPTAKEVEDFIASYPQDLEELVGGCDQGGAGRGEVACPCSRGGVCLVVGLSEESRAWLPCTRGLQVLRWAVCGVCGVQVLRELYRWGWEVNTARLAVRRMQQEGTLVPEDTAAKPFTRAEAMLFERAMQESWKDFCHASVSETSTRNDVVAVVMVMMNAGRGS
jgi:hypothetical protein